MKIAIITNNPAPYRDAVYTTLSSIDGIDICLFYCTRREPNRHWYVKDLDYKVKYLRSYTIRYSGQYTHIAFSISKYLRNYNPDAVITSGYGPIMLQALIWANLNKKPHIVFTDGTLKSEERLTIFHKLLRKMFFSKSAAFIGASEGSKNLFRKYGIDESKIFQSHLCVQNENYFDIVQEKKFDIMFCGQLIERKLPLFFCDVAENLKKIRGDCRALIVGTGEFEGAVRKKLKDAGVTFVMTGFVQQDRLPLLYKSAKLFLFPTRQDPWGVVANEAAAAGLPIITTPEAGVAGELVLNEKNGFVAAPDPEIWSKLAFELLENDELYAKMSRMSEKISKNYNSESAAMGILSATLFSVKSFKAANIFK